MAFSVGGVWVLRASLALVGLTGCQAGASTVRSKFALEFSCPENEITVDADAESPSQFHASGCREEALYECRRGDCKRADVATDEESEPRSLLVVVGGRSADDQPEARREKGPGGKTVVALDMRLDDRTQLRLRAAPEAHGELVQVKLVHQGDREELEDCELGFMVNGEPLAPPRASFSHEHTTSSLRSDVPRDLVRQLGAVQQFALKSCDLRWTLRPEQLAEVRQFVALYEEEMAWGGKTRDAPSGLLAPAGGWPEWKISAAAPQASKATALAGQELFKLLAPSVFQVEALLQSGISQGSAVAVSDKQLLSNCHVVQGAQTVVVKQGKNKWVADLERADPGSDRCVLRVESASFTPVRGVRAAADLQVGERLYTLGSPSGLELTLADGLLSSIREEEGRRYVQTTAPISPGSSGGGLFDTRGNLVGITVMALVGKKRLNQALNFAIPAADFWRP